MENKLHKNEELIKWKQFKFSLNSRSRVKEIICFTSHAQRPVFNHIREGALLYMAPSKSLLSLVVTWVNLLGPKPLRYRDGVGNNAGQNEKLIKI